ncbi:MAG: copper homeostasis protein CutC [Tunicatimonas sp.]
MVQLEVCVDSVASAMNAEWGGADRVELCDNLFEGGTTPSAGCIAVARTNLSIGLQVIIRPRGGDFLYDEGEVAVMRHDIKIVKELGADGVVIGALTAPGEVDRAITQQLIELARPMNVTFHRAFDMTADPFQALEDLIELGVDRVLTSGQQTTAWEGVGLIEALVKKAASRIIVVPGGGINEHNIQPLVQQTGVRECHVSGRRSQSSQMQYQNHQVYLGGALRLPEYERKVTDTDRIAQFRQLTE